MLSTVNVCTALRFAGPPRGVRKDQYTQNTVQHTLMISQYGAGMGVVFISPFVSERHRYPLLSAWGNSCKNLILTELDERLAPAGPAKTVVQR